MIKKGNMSDGYCQCGCGKPTRIIPYDNKATGWIKGQYTKFIYGHQLGKNSKAPAWKGGKTHDSRGYERILNNHHPRAHKTGYVYKHILIAEKALGKSLPPKVVIHHFPNIKNFTHLIICENQGYHLLLESRYRALKSSGNVHKRKCQFCGTYDIAENLCFGKRSIYHKICGTKYIKDRQIKIFNQSEITNVTFMPKL